MPPIQPPDRGFEHTIKLEPGVQAIITTPYRHPKAYRDEKKRVIHELLALGHIRPSSSPYASSVVLVKKKDESHLETIVHILEEQHFYAKLSKCEFRLVKMLYLGHIIGVDGVRVHAEKIRDIQDWLEPQNVTELRGFIGIFTYYRKFVKGFSQLASPPTDLTKKGAFEWTTIAQEAFDRLKEVISGCPVLALPDFNQSFVLECDASGVGVRVVLM
eukprot:PITA_29990